MLFRIISIAAMLMLIAGCVENTGDEDTTPPQAPVLREKLCYGDAPEFPEQGIDIESGSSGSPGIRIEWILPQVPEDLAGFRVYSATSPDSEFVSLGFDPLSFLDDPQAEYYFAVDRGSIYPSEQVPSHGKRQWYCVTAIDDSGNESAPSDTVSYQLWDSCNISESQVVVADDSLIVEWTYDHGWPDGLRGHMCFVVPASRDSVCWSHFVQQDLEQHVFQFRWSLEDELRLLPGDYRLRVDTVIDAGTISDAVSNPSGCALAGSESTWISFTY